MKKIYSKNTRLFIQLGFLIFVTTLAVLHQKLGGGPDGSASVHAICPFGGLESLHSFFLKGEFIQKTYYSNMVLLGGTTLLVVFFGRIFCGWICALGTLQDIFGKIGKKIFKKRFYVPSHIDRPLRSLKYLVFAAILYFTWKTGELVINYFDPFAAYSHIPAGIDELLGEYIIGFSILLLMLFAAIFYDRLFCRYLCPLGAYYAVINKLSVFKIRREKEICIDCGKCDKVCPASINISHNDSVAKAECFSCMECVESCPTKKKSLEASFVKKPVNFKKVGVIGVTIFLMTVFVTKSIGLYKTTPDTVKAILNGNPQNIRGWMSIEDVSKGFDIPQSEIYQELGISQEQLPSGISIKESETHLQNQGIIFDHDKIGEVISGLLAKNGVDLSSKSSLNFSFRGSMSISDVSQASGFSVEEVIDKLRLPEGIPTDRPLKEMSAEYGYSMESLKSRAEKELISN